MTFQIATGVWWVSTGEVTLRWQLSADACGCVGGPLIPLSAGSLCNRVRDKSVRNQTLRIQNPQLLQNNTAHLGTSNVDDPWRYAPVRCAFAFSQIRKTECTKNETRPKTPNRVGSASWQ